MSLSASNKKTLNIFLLLFIIGIFVSYIAFNHVINTPSLDSQSTLSSDSGKVAKPKVSDLTAEQKEEYQALQAENKHLEGLNDKAQTVKEELAAKQQELLEKDQAAEKIIAELEAKLQDK